ncbi:MAG: hypothetical protein ABI865_12755, partial [Nitrosospira sp.]
STREINSTHQASFARTSLINTFSELVVVIDSSMPRHLQKELVPHIAAERAKMYKRTLLLVPAMAMRQRNLLNSWLDQTARQSGVTVLTMYESSTIPTEVADYLSRIVQPLCNVFFDDSSSLDIRKMINDLYATYGNKAASVRWHNLSILGHDHQQFAHCSMIDSACRFPKLQENIYLISEAFIALAVDKAGRPENSSVASLLPRIVDWRTNGTINQKFVFTHNSANRFLSDRLMRYKLAHYWRYAEFLRYPDASELKYRIVAILENAI